MKKEYDFTRAKRAKFRGLPPMAERARHTKVRITIMLDQDLLRFFKARAAEPGAEPYQTQINRALREHVFGSRHPQGKHLLKDEGFISRLAERVAAYASRVEPRPRATRKATTPP